MIWKLIKINQWNVILLMMIILPMSCNGQDYDVNEIQCSFASQGSTVGDAITAKLKKPIGFKGAPLFADDRSVLPENDFSCSIKLDLSDPTELSYDLKIIDFTRCGVLKRNGFVHVRIWFPQFPGVVMQSDQELIIMCKPPESTVIQNKAAGFAGSFPHGARVSGVVEETPGRLEYEVALYKEAPPIGRINGQNHVKNSSANIHNSEVPVDQAVAIGTKLQLRARISTLSVWKYVKLMEVTVSPDPDDPHALGSVLLVKEGCRNRDFASIIPHQPARYRDKPNEVFLDFEAFLLSSMKERSTLWIHSQIKACMDAIDCQPDFCLDLYEPQGLKKNPNAPPHGLGRRRRRDSGTNNSTIEFTKFKENIEYTVIMPGEFETETKMTTGSADPCRSFILMSGLLSALLALSTVITCSLVIKMQNINRKRILDDIVNNQGYAGRAIVQ